MNTFKSGYEGSRRQAKLRISFPSRDDFRLRTAAARAKLRYFCEVEIFNPAAVSQSGKPGGPQWIRLVVALPNRIIGAIDLTGPNQRGSPMTPHGLRLLRSKAKYLEGRGIPYLLIDRRRSVVEMQLDIELWTMKLQKEN